MSAVAEELKELIDKLKEKVSGMEEVDKIEAINYVKEEIDKVNPIAQPVSVVKWVPAEKVMANDYNPNHVAPPEMKLLHTSIKADGYTQPIVSVWIEELGKYVIVDGFNRNKVGKEYKDIQKMCKGYLPITTIHGSKDRLIASTIRHNRARGKHSIEGMVNIIILLSRAGYDDTMICRELGMDLDEVLRLKQTSGIAEVFRNAGFSRAWENNSGK